MRKWIRRLLAAIVVLVLAALLGAWWLLRGSLPQLDGELALPGLSAPATVARDALGVVTIDADNETDAMRALGYVHAQERYFEMDLMRRMSAGELSALLGERALETDRRQRVHRMRARVENSLAAVAGERLAQLQAYTDGVNAGREALRTRPWPYLLLRQQPQPWTAADSALAGYALYFDLQDAGNARELALHRLRAELPTPLFALLTHDGSSWDAPLFGAARGDAVLPDAEMVDLRVLPGVVAGVGEVEVAAAQDDGDASGLVRTPPSALQTVPLSRAAREKGVGGSPAAWGAALSPPPALQVVPLSPASREKSVGGSPAAWGAALSPPPAPQVVPLSPASRERGVGGSPAATDLRGGSNNFAVSGRLTDGRAIVADDMHLGLRAPNIWFRARLRYADARAPGGRVDVTGFTLPGLPAVIVGSNTHVAWGFTNSYGDYLDWQRVRPCTGETQGTGDCTPLVGHSERIEVAGGNAETLEVRESEWGPVLHEEPDGSALALRWVAHLPGALDFGLADLAHARDLDDALAIADRAAIPTQNLLVGDRRGQIAWRLVGPLPVRSAGCDGRGVSRPPSDDAATDPGGSAALPACAPWSIATDRSPLLRSPTADRLWTANSRVVDGADFDRIGDGGAALGARAQQIRNALFARERFTEQDLLDIQLDDRAVLMTRWWELLGDIAQQADTDTAPALHALADAATQWSGHASIDSVGYRLVRAWRLAVHERIAAGLTAPAQAALGDDFALPDLPNFEGVAWPLVEQRPAHLLPRRFACAPQAGNGACVETGDGWLALFEDAARQVRDGFAGQGPLTGRTWGERNTAAICHPLAGAIPLIGKRALCMPADPLPGDGMMPRVQGPGFGASQRMVVAPGFEADGITHMPGGQSGHPLSPFWGAGHEDWAQGRPSPFLPGSAVHTMQLLPGG
ncbi:penicillin acylase family protein [Luteimonas sp. BDR2-5]|uniref:penicillin acylase family protein n=1 Tax=Proluteimonas luteida TaxID=2878685 RepID=UPI001E553D9C|nr:penicillin acylase family protein [Luteimonas sp. BDR2-5]MCD9028485.1 penicillin acylase family protein [Luteimonas sp. BDR2-5]